MLRSSFWASALLVLAGCASKLPSVRATNAPRGLEKPLDIAAIAFNDVHTGAAVNLRDYMADQGRDYVLLMFGSQGCTACNDEAKALKKQVIGLHPLFLTEEGKHFEIIGVNTDPVSLRQLAPFVANYPFIKWSDPAAVLMRTFFLPKGLDVKVPLTVMLGSNGQVAWRILPDEAEKTSMDELMAKVEATLGVGDGGSGTDTGAGTGTGTDTGGDAGNGGSDTVPATDLANEGPGRLKSVAVTSCDGQSGTLDAALGQSDYRFVQIVRGACTDACQTNLAQLKSLTCVSATCAAVSLSTDGPAAAECASGLALKGGAEFFDVFKTHFDWAYTPLDSGPPTYQLSLPPVAGPLLLGFGPKGELVYSHDGKLGAGELQAAVSAANFGKELARGPDFALYGAQLGAKQDYKFADWRRQAKYTVLNAWGAYPVPCGSCIDELKRWSEPNQLVDFCAARPADCQVAALESHTPQYPASTMAEYYDQVVTGDGQGWTGLAAQGIRMPLVLDAVPDPDGNNYINRLFDGYMVAVMAQQHPDWDQQYRTFIYDREGKIVAAFRSAPGSADSVLEKLVQLLGND